MDNNDKDLFLAFLYAISRGNNFFSTKGCEELKGKLANEESSGAALEQYFSSLDSRALDEARREIGEARDSGVSLVSYFDDSYPASLKHISDPPLLLFYRGTLLPVEPTSSAVGIVGARRCSEYGRTTAYRISRELSRYELPVVSGLAFGIDAEAHRGALLEPAANPGVAVLGSGLGRIYPRENTRLAEELISSGGALVSEYGVSARGAKHFFPRRNRIISGLVDVLIVVEASSKSGSLITARLALEQGREVLAVPGALSSAESEGTNHLISQGAHIFTRIGDVLALLPEQAKRKLRASRSEQKKTCKSRTRSSLLAGLELETQELARMELVISLLSHKSSLDFEGLANKSKLHTAEIYQAVSRLELEGIVRVLAGERYVLNEAIDS